MKEVGNIDFTWGEAVAAMGDGTWTLQLQLTNDAIKKVGGSATVLLSSDSSLTFFVKGVCKPRTDISVLVQPSHRPPAATLKNPLKEIDSLC